ncbi:MAG: hypothetical protein CML68_13675 [Rhodobacteraceae bacterium]|nr:hypothetical protein [Paracoccaceae bacterium]
MTREELQAAMTAADAEYVEKTGRQPYMGASLNLDQRDEWEARVWMTFDGDSKWLRAYGADPEAAIAKLSEAIAALPSEEETNLLEFQRDLGHLIDKGRKFGIDVAYVNPLAETAKALAENALTYQGAAE